MKILFTALAAIVLALVVVGGCMYSGYNRAVTLDEEVQSTWAQVENQLQRRFDLIDNVVSTVKGVAGHEADVFLGLAEARASYTQAKSVGQKALSLGMFNVSGLLSLHEQYPELKANTSFLKLQDQLEGTENRIGLERKRYNEAVKGLNVFRRKLLGRVYAGWAGVDEAEYFEVAEEAKAVPKVDFGK
ncbi:MAG: LemA family protein [Planctomycetes bacterium]|nr:LemA family protein [Planctomycetota bacterium]